MGALYKPTREIFFPKWEHYINRRVKYFFQNGRVNETHATMITLALAIVIAFNKIFNNYYILKISDRINYFS